MYAPFVYHFENKEEEKINYPMILLTIKMIDNRNWKKSVWKIFTTHMLYY